MTFEEIREKIKDYTVGIAGCGGLGSNCAVMLIRTGICKLVIADFDIISEGNLNRQFFFKHQIGQPKAAALRGNLHLINPDAEIEAHDLKLDDAGVASIFAHCDIIVEAFDHAEAKQMIIEAVSAHFPDKPLVCASGLGGLHNAENMNIMRHGNLTVVGDFLESVSENNPPLAPKVSIAAALQANEVLKILLGE